MTEAPGPLDGPVELEGPLDGEEFDVLLDGAADLLDTESERGGLFRPRSRRRTGLAPAGEQHQQATDRTNGHGEEEKPADEGVLGGPVPLPRRRTPTLVVDHGRRLDEPDRGRGTEGPDRGRGSEGPDRGHGVDGPDRSRGADAPDRAHALPELDQPLSGRAHPAPGRVTEGFGRAKDGPGVADHHAYGTGRDERPASPSGTGRPGDQPVPPRGTGRQHGLPIAPRGTGPTLVPVPPERPGPAASPEPFGGLPRRVRQASLAPQLRAADGPAERGTDGRADARTSGGAAPTDADSFERDAEEVRARMAAMQRGWQRGRQHNADPD
ncbi:histidine kinase, partial [Streptomyces massasporeus]